MKGAEVLADLVVYLARSVRREIEGLSHEELTWQPDAEGNNIAITVWHFSRWLDLLTVRAFENRPPEEEQWHIRGWAKKTGYDPRGIGYQGFGVLADYTQKEVAEVPVLDANELITYLDQERM
jgi:DinB superfamily